MSDTQERAGPDAHLWFDPDVNPGCGLIHFFMVETPRFDPGVEAALEQTEVLLIIDLILLQIVNYEHTHTALGYGLPYFVIFLCDQVDLTNVCNICNKCL